MSAEVLRQTSVAWGFMQVPILMSLLFRSRCSKERAFLLAMVFLGPLMVVNSILVINLGIPRAGQLFIITLILPSLLFFYLISGDRTAKFAFTFCGVNTAIYWILSLTALLDHYLGDGSGMLVFAMRLVLPTLLVWCVYRWLRKPYLELQEQVPKGWGLFAIVSVTYYMLLVVMSGFPSPIEHRRADIPAYLLVLLLLPCIYATIFISLYQQLLLYRREKNDHMLQAQKRQLETRLENQLRIRKLQHDMKGNVVTLSGLLAAGRVEEAQEYLKTMGAGIDTATNRFCGNPYLNSVLSHYYQKFEELGANERMDIQVGSEALPGEDLLCQILANGLENAFDALCDLPREDRELSVQMRYNRDYLLIRVKNRCNKELRVEKGTLPKTTKGGMDHGLGLLTVSEYAQRLGGELLCYTEGGCFLMDVMVKVRVTD